MTFQIFKTTRRTLRDASLALLGVGLLAAPHSFAQEGEVDEAAVSMFTFEYAGGDKLFQSEKDQSLVRAMQMVPARWEELRALIPDLRDVPPQAADLFFAAVRNPTRVAIVDHGADEETGMPRIGLVVSWKMVGDDPREMASAMHEDINFMSNLAGGRLSIEPSEQFDGMQQVLLPFGALNYGPRNSPDGWRYEILFGHTPDPDALFGGLPEAPPAVDVVMRGSVDLAGWTPLVNMFGGFALMMIPNGQDIMRQMREKGLVGPEAMSFEWTSGYRGGSSFQQYVMRGANRYADALTMTHESIATSDLLAIPEDAIFAHIHKFDAQAKWNSFASNLRTHMGDEFEVILSRIREVTGYDFETQILPAIGSTSTMYLSDATGAGAVTSTVLLLSLKDRATIVDLLDHLTNMANGLIAEQIDGPFAVRFVSTEAEGTQFVQLRFDGLPVPIEPTFAVTGDLLIAAASPQACAAAWQQATNRKGGLPRNESFREHGMRFRNSESTMLLFVDTRQTMRTAYPYLSMLGTAVGNSVRGPAEDTRNAGMVVPPYAILRENVEPIIARSYWSGDDYITDFTGDGSALVNISGLMGVGDMAPFIAGAVTGGAIATKAMEERMQHERRHGTDHRHHEHDEHESEGAGASDRETVDY